MTSIEAALAAGIRHFIYVSVAHPAPVMKAYWGVRARCERVLRETRLKATILRPWYVLGPGHRWAYALVPMYALLERIPATAAAAKRTGLVRLAEMVAALASAVEHPPAVVRIVEVPEIRASR